MSRIVRSSRINVRDRRLMIFQRFGRRKTLIQRCTRATKPKKNAHSETSAANLAHRIADLRGHQTKAAEIFVAEFLNVQQNEKIRRAEFAVERRRTTDQCPQPQIAL